MKTSQQKLLICLALCFLLNIIMGWRSYPVVQNCYKRLGNDMAPFAQQLSSSSSLYSSRPSISHLSFLLPSLTGSPYRDLLLFVNWGKYRTSSWPVVTFVSMS